jgi:signal transduction histidine kinase
MVTGGRCAYRVLVIRELLRPWRRAQTWWSLTYVLLDVLVGACTFSAVIVLLALSVGLLITFPLAIPCIWLLFVSSHLMAAAERSRFRALLDVRFDDPVRPLQAGSWWGRLVERVRSGARWREVLYLVLLLPVGVLTTVVAVTVWCGSAALIALPLYVSHLPGGTAKFWLFEIGPGAGALAASLVGIAGLVLLAPWATLGLAWLDTVIGRRLLAPRPKDELGERVEALETSRAAAVDSAEAERRRIERDLHDGAQQRLVSLAMGLGAARQRLEEDHVAGRRMVAEAHEDAKAALKELRDLVRGIHPVILEDRGLDAALSAIVARAPVPVTLDITVAERPSAAVESTAYFVVAEALTNIARHAEATSAAVTIERAGDRLVVEIRDDGRGGADFGRGTGLAGLRNRVTGLGGTMHVVSPTGGPTTLLVEIPCAS